MSFRPPKPESATIEGPVGCLEAIYEEPGESTAGTAAVICHPHPLYHGTMNNKVVHTVARTLQRFGMPTLRFNFRGVGGSEGDYGEGIGETDDAVAAVAWIKKRRPNDDILLAGFSFGALVALRATSVVKPVDLITVAPAVHRVDVSDVQVPECPWLILQGEADELVDVDAVIEWVNELPPGPELVLLTGVDHFFHGKLTLLKEAIVNWLESVKT